MEQLFSAFQSAFDFSARKGWIMFLFGTLMIVLMKAGSIPTEDTQPGWFTLFVAVAVLGAVILLVHLFAWMIGNHRSHAAYEAKKKSQARQLQALFEEGRRNLDVLNSTETMVLIWLLRQEKERFSAEIKNSNGAMGLLNKGLVYRDAGTRADNVWVINPMVWNEREPILARHEDIQTPPQPPWDPWNSW
ncbi:hypothetical protein KUG85_04790 [Nitratireductor sp. L1-7-SE]|uniref:Uncharacterized protein n=1 Tax=Nitratireductor rhodophyticola TaxID=2854036 RepID=A0ABS7RD30_9HYPH|nr:hypothetical protein [Nitratireductor rhodophyticola]MBY8918810.1 hypothetical protein [Nitratireductor rhodophyticola]MBY8920007.1 hypothetical protein [Nitratireductor rhodophyticola]